MAGNRFFYSACMGLRLYAAKTGLEFRIQSGNLCARFRYAILLTLVASPAAARNQRGHRF